MLEDGSDGGSEGGSEGSHAQVKGGRETVIPVGLNLVIPESGCVQGRDGLEPRRSRHEAKEAFVSFLRVSPVEVFCLGRDALVCLGEVVRGAGGTGWT